MSRTLLVLLFLYGEVNAQHRADNWMLGYYYNNERHGLNFTNNQPDTFSFTGALNFFITNASISDTTGQLQFYTNGQLIYNRNHDTLLNSLNFNPGFGTQFYYNSGAGYYTGHGIPQGAIAIPDPGNTQRYYIFYETFNPYFNYQLPGDTKTYYNAQPFYLSYSVIDMTLDNGLGGIVSGQKNIHAINDTLLLGRITACKHGNGRDWWLLVHEYYSDNYYTLLVSPDGVSMHFQQQNGLFLMPSDGINDFDRAGQACFSPDGSKYAMMGGFDSLEIFDFDRCTGFLSNHRIATVPDSGVFFARGVSFSPNSRYLYTSNIFKTYQYDTWASNIDSSRVLVAEWDSFNVGGINIFFHMHQLSSDEKIYISSFHGAYYYHVINFPDSAGIACNVTQHSLELANYNLTIPNFPNYELTALTGSACDSLTVSISTVSGKNESQLVLRYFEDREIIYIKAHGLKRKASLVSIIDQTGRVVLSSSEFVNDFYLTKEFDLSSQSSGVYFVMVQTESEKLVGKFVKL